MSTGHPLPPPSPADLVKPRSDRSSQGLGVSGLNYWKRLGWKISLLSAHLSLLASVFVIPFVLWLVMSGGFGGGAFSSGMMATMFGFMLLGIPLGWVFSFLMSALLCLLVLPATALSIRAFGVKPARDTIGKVAGSAVALAGSTGSFTDPFGTASGLPGQTAGMGAWLLFSLAFNVSACQAGGCLASLEDLRRRRQGRLKTKETWRLTTWAMLALTAIVSVLLALLKATGLLSSVMVICLTLGVVLAYGLHRPVAWLTNRWLDWRLKKRRKKRAVGRITPPATPAAPSS